MEKFDIVTYAGNNCYYLVLHKFDENNFNIIYLAGGKESAIMKAKEIIKSIEDVPLDDFVFILENQVQKISLKGLCYSFFYIGNVDTRKQFEFEF